MPEGKDFPVGTEGLENIKKLPPHEALLIGIRGMDERTCHTFAWMLKRMDLGGHGEELAAAWRERCKSMLWRVGEDFLGVPSALLNEKIYVEEGN